MEKVKIQSFGNEENFYYFTIKKQGYSFAWLTVFTDLVKEVSLSLNLIGNRMHDEEDDFQSAKMIDKHESYSANNSRIDLFYGKDIIYITVSSNTINKGKFLDAMENLADFP